MTTQTATRATSARSTGGRAAWAWVLAAMLASLAGSATPARAATITLDTGLAGADFDAILDGFPGLAPFDGLGDLPGNALAVSLKAGVTEERALIELPLAPLASAGVGADQIASAVLTFNIDDVLTTFGPGTDFDSTASERIYVATYSGNGNVDLDDFTRGTLAATVTTGPHGAITDASVRTGGPITYTVDLTASVKALVAGGATHVGIAFSTDDSPTGTSIDDRGDGGTGAPGTGGAKMPFLVVTTAEATPTPVPTAIPSPVPTVGPTSVPTATPSPGPTTSPGATPSPGATASPAPTHTGGPGFTPTPRPTVTAQPTAGPTPTTGQATPTPVQTGGATPTPAATSTPVGSGTPGPTTTPGSSSTPRPTTTPVGTATPATTTTPGSSSTPRPTATPVATFDPNATPTPRPILTASPRPTGSPGNGTPTPAPTGGSTVPPVTEIPDGSGDQLVFFYDARDGATTFLNLHNLGDEALELRVVLYDAALAAPFTSNLSLEAGATRTLDVGTLRGDGLPARAGAAFAHAVDDAGNAIVTRALGGNFTVANLATGSAWGAPAAARRAVLLGATATVPALGTTIDGDDVRLRGIRPDRVGLSVYYDPSTLEPAAIGGNQLVFLSFDDDGVTPVPSTTRWSIVARRSDGSTLDGESTSVDGVLLSHLEEILGDGANGASGSITFSTTGGAQSRLVFFSESLGTFATGYLLPPVAE